MKHICSIDSAEPVVESITLVMPIQTIGSRFFAPTRLRLAAESSVVKKIARKARKAQRELSRRGLA